MGVITAQHGVVLEDATQDFLCLVASGQAPLPLAFDFMEQPAQLATNSWRTMLRLPADSDAPTGIASFFPDYSSASHPAPAHPAPAMRIAAFFNGSAGLSV